MNGYASSNHLLGGRVTVNCRVSLEKGRAIKGVTELTQMSVLRD